MKKIVKPYRKPKNELSFYFKISRRANSNKNPLGLKFPLVVKYCISVGEDSEAASMKSNRKLTEIVKRMLAKELGIGSQYLFRISNRKGYRILEE